ncbi:50S ribosomal protein L15 [candidate division WWE3 bacterium CG09_land_8_20_14_0_10_47_33]|uniref:Large ribosomal subunit protein uL15 n=1 Tax=candidate division WWE3 bacterium CG_4_9_14_0_2_um_filter_48_10 TaxID=1975078 RepID=A0A2M8EJS6_UNCKA|nr:MAG: 50S ribosomal protein L15 [candidate division WWE3 bacterium CG09_land_8_20_14_0_10_47_33]PIZ40534.1 MAG: 50S ribosomal protein L15 [candidate division WWE3 bacterium CG_4_10_14_0_2_um_filter_47_8]PJC22985.1 MAG: 50S ribosomal protein L15 [candidate division WWE3 bacterium CG_4_9_14_0_2_um_filter_48_10]PJE51227.1 MAG: 50S ribosomal protein L15 [candidate division WWE3 bacterium CG10_big_fil_rev_8_21_14_0_10_48_23]
MRLNNLPRLVGKKKKRLGRGYGSGKGGHTVGHGTKGQKVRGRIKLGFEGGQFPLVRRLPRLGGFRSIRGKPAVLNLGNLTAFRKGEIVSPETLKEKGLIKKIPSAGIKILGEGEAKALKFKGVLLSAPAREKILKAGGKIEK